MSHPGAADENDKPNQTGAPAAVLPEPGLRWQVHYGAYVAIAVLLVLINLFYWEDITAEVSQDLALRLVIGPLYPELRGDPKTRPNPNAGRDPRGKRVHRAGGDPRGRHVEGAGGDPKAGREHMAVVLFTESNLSIFDETWPVSLKTHAEVLLAIYRQKPMAVMVDFAFIDEREDDSLDGGLEAMKRVIALYESEPEIPLYFARADGPGAAPIRSDLAEHAKLVSVAVPKGDGVDRTYWPCRKLPGENGSAAAPGAGAPCACVVADGESTKIGPCPAEDGEIALSAAFKLFQDVQKSNGSFDPDHPFNFDWMHPIDMDVVWTNRVDPLNDSWMRSQDGECEKKLCRNLGGGFSKWMWRALTDSKSFRQPCPYTPTLSAAAVRFGFRNPTVKSALNGKVVFYGGDLLTLGDMVSPPTNEPLPGVYWHAMALDNLLTYDGDYKRSKFALGGPPISAKVFEYAIAIALAIGTVAYARRDAANRGMETDLSRARGLTYVKLLWRQRRYWLVFNPVVFVVLLGVTFGLYSLADISPRNWLGFFGLAFLLSQIAFERWVECFATILSDMDLIRR